MRGRVGLTCGVELRHLVKLREVSRLEAGESASCSTPRSLSRSSRPFMSRVMDTGAKR